MNIVTKHRMGNLIQSIFALIGLPLIIFFMYKSLGGIPENISDSIFGDVRLLIVVVGLSSLLVFITSIFEVFKSKEKIIEDKRKLLVNRKKRFLEIVEMYDKDIQKFDKKIENQFGKKETV